MIAETFVKSFVRVTFVVIEFFVDITLLTVFSQPTFTSKVNNANIRTMCEICLELTFVLVSLLLILNRFHKSFWCFHHWLSKSKCWLGLFFCFHYFITDLQGYEITAIQNTSVFYFFPLGLRFSICPDVWNAEGRNMNTCILLIFIKNVILQL